jgi:hypothetical protein
MTPKVMHAATPRTGNRSILMNAIIYPITMSHVNKLVSHFETPFEKLPAERQNSLPGKGLFLVLQGWPILLG